MENGSFRKSSFISRIVEFYAAVIGSSCTSNKRLISRILCSPVFTGATNQARKHNVEPGVPLAYGIKIDESQYQPLEVVAYALLKSSAPMSSKPTCSIISCTLESRNGTTAVHSFPLIAYC